MDGRVCQSTLCSSCIVGSGSCCSSAQCGQTSQVSVSTTGGNRGERRGKCSRLNSGLQLTQSTLDGVVVSDGAATECCQMGSTISTTCQGDQIINIQIRLTDAEFTSGSVVVEITASTQSTTDARVCDEEVGRSLNNVIGGKLIKGNRQITSRELNTSAIGEVSAGASSSGKEVSATFSQVISVDIRLDCTQCQQVTQIIIRCRNTCAATDQSSNTIIDSLISEVKVSRAFRQSIGVVVSNTTNL